MKIKSEEFNDLIGWAVRYCCGRATYAPHMLVHIINKYWDQLTDTNLYHILLDIEKQKKWGLGMDMDVELWTSLQSRIRDRLKREEV